MKVFGFFVSKERNFVHITCNIILGLTFLCVLVFSLASPVAAMQVSGSSYSAIYNGPRDTNKVSLMINVYWGDEYLDDMLKTLEENNVKTTFFVGGCWVAKNNEMLQKIVNAGHEIGNHGYFHKDHSKLNNTQNKDEIVMTQKLVESISAYKTTLFAPPSGSFSQKTLAVAESLGYKTIMWSRDTIDWRDKDQNLIFKRATENTIGGDLILMHPTSQTASCLDKIIKELKSKNLQITTVSDCLGLV